MSLASVLFPGYRRRVLGLLLLHPSQSFHVREIARLTGSSTGSLTRELSKLADAGLLIRERQGNQVRYAANRGGLVFEELASILRKTSGLADVLAAALLPLTTRIRAAFVFGSMATGKATMQSDVDILIIGDVEFGEAVECLFPAQATIGREINPKVFSAPAWQALLHKGGAFICDVLAKPKLFVIGGPDDLG